LKVQKTPVRVEAAADIVQTLAAPGVPGEQKILIRVAVGAANNGGSSGEAKAARVAELLAHNRPITKNGIPIAKASVNRADIRLML
jgi:hypothetical protein